MAFRLRRAKVLC